MSPTSYLTAPPRGATYEVSEGARKRQRSVRSGAVRAAVIDIGTNTTRLLVAEVEDGRVVELERRTTITSLGQGLDATGRLSEAAMDRVTETLGAYREVVDRIGVETVVAVATSAMRDAENGPAFRDFLKERFGIEARTISGDEEARLTFLGATAGRGDDRETLVIDIGGGSTEYVVGRPGRAPEFHDSTQMGSVRHTERFLHGDPPQHEELQRLAADVRETVPDVSVEQGIAVAGTATSLAAIDGAEELHGHHLSLATCERLVAMLAALPVDERRNVKGLHPDRAPTIVAGAVILTESIRTLGLDEIEVSVADILHGAALTAAP
jgi:exopolyphosphatase/guanosine-5'-triphosphate,3'-diphosphate pyrophosphatase